MYTIEETEGKYFGLLISLFKVLSFLFFFFKVLSFKMKFENAL